VTTSTRAIRAEQSSGFTVQLDLLFNIFCLKFGVSIFFSILLNFQHSKFISKQLGKVLKEKKNIDDRVDCRLLGTYGREIGHLEEAADCEVEQL
jgi:hypothetical protein